MKRFWQWVSSLGIDPEMSAREQKVLIQFNKNLLVALAMAVYGTLSQGVIAFVGDFILDISMWHYWPYVVPFVGASLLDLALFILWVKFKWSFLPVLVSATSIVAISAISLMGGRELAFQYFLILAIPGFFFSSDWKNRRSTMFMTGLVVVAFIGIHIHYQYFEPLFPVTVEAIIAVAYYTAFVVLPVVMYFIVYIYWRDSALLEDELDNERGKADKLLMNVLPERVAIELKETGATEPVHFESATIFFTDFVGFTRISQELSPADLIGELDNCFSYFDQVCEKYGLEKLKTIGDAFMAAGGIPEPSKTHAFDVCLAALEIQAFMNQMRDIKAAQQLPYWELRLGINTGPVVAGVIGEKKFAYDVWGDTVNTASRMESSGVTGRINLSKATFEIVKNVFACEYRGRLVAKNKGEVDMYFLNSMQSAFAEDDAGRVPNQKYFEYVGGR